VTATAEKAWKVVLIVEDDTDGRILRRLLAATGVGVEAERDEYGCGAES